MGYIMDSLNIDFKRLLPYVVDAFTKVYGQEYHDIILRKINNAIIVPYYDIEGLSNYLLYIKKCKRRECAIEFLDKIGIDVEKSKGNYSQSLDIEFEKILGYYIGSSFLGFSENADYYAPLQSFKPNNMNDSKILLNNKIKIVNYFLDKKHQHITKDKFNLFVETEEYRQILKEINEINIVYEHLLSEYRKWEARLQPYEDFVECEEQRKSKILERKKILTFKDIFFELPFPLRKAFSDKSMEESCNIIFGDSYIDRETIIESFSLEKMEKLKSKEVSLFDKFCIVSLQAKYLRNIGVNITNESMLECDSEEDVNNYLLFLSQEDISRYIPSNDVIKHITSVRKNKYEEGLKEYYATRRDFIDIKEKFGYNADIYEVIKNKNICVTYATTDDNQCMSLLFFTIKRFDEGSLFRVFMHECGHIIDICSEGAGFDVNDTDFNKNPYDTCFRKYEKFNEVLNDIFTEEAIHLLHDQGVYLIEPKKFTVLDTSNHNTALITKTLLQPLLLKFRKQVVSAKVNTDPNELIKYIGEDNFEGLVDVVNKVDYLSRNGVISKIDTIPEDEMVQEYFKQLERVRQIYSSIDNYYKENIESLQLNARSNDTKKSR